MASSSSQARRGEGFSTGVTAADARRQLRLSFGLVVALAACILSAAVSVGHHPVAAKRDLVSVLPVVTMYADTDAIGAKAI